MVAPGFLANPEVRRYLDGVEPAWTLLEFESFNSLGYPPSATNKAIRLEPNLTETDLLGSVIGQVARMLLGRAGNPGGLKLTATGNLSRAVVGELVEIIDWPGLDKKELFSIRSLTSRIFYRCISSASCSKRPSCSEPSATS